MLYNLFTGHIWDPRMGPEEIATVAQVVEQVDLTDQHRVGILLAAAPELLEACKAALTPLQHLAAHGTLPAGTTLGDLPVLQLCSAIGAAEDLKRSQ